MTLAFSPVSRPLAAPACLLRGLRLLAHPELRSFVWIPLAINLLFYSLGVWLGLHYFESVMERLIPGSLDWLRWLLWPVLAAFLAVFVFFTFTVVANLIASPFYGLLALEVCKVLGIVRPSSGGGESLIAAVGRDVYSELGRLVYFAVRATPLLVVSLLPVVNLVAPFLWLWFGAWSLSLEYLAYPLETRGLRFVEQREMAKTGRFDVLLFGGLVLLGLGVPVLNLLIPPAAVIGATLFAAERRWLAD